MTRSSASSSPTAAGSTPRHPVSISTSNPGAGHPGRRDDTSRLASAARRACSTGMVRTKLVIRRCSGSFHAVGNAGSQTVRTDDVG